MVKPIVALSAINKNYNLGADIISVLKDINLTIEPQELLAIVGSSGSGKSTLMNIIGLLDKPNSGEYLFNSHSILSMPDNAQAILRNKSIGFVFQQFNLLPRLTAYQNIALPLQYHPQALNIQAKVMDMLKKVGMENYTKHKPNQLSGGQQQRIAIARALVCDPEIILADEPTGSLDSKTGQEIMKLFINLNLQGKTIVLITHDPKIALQCRRKITLQDGSIAE